MYRPSIDLGSAKPIALLVVAGFVLATLSCSLYGIAAEACGLLHSIGWVALELARPAILEAWQCVPAHFCAGSSLLQHFLQVVASNWTLLCVVAG